METLIDKYIMGLYQDFEDEVIADIARRVKKTGRYTETAELMAKSMVEQGYSAEKIQAEVMKMLRADKAYQMAVAENTAAYKQEIQNLINQTVQEAKKVGDALVAEAGNMAWNNDLSMWKEQGVDLKKPNSMGQLLAAFQAQTAGELKNLTRTMGFKNTVFGTTGILNAYQREMDLALLKVATGAFSYDQAVNDCVHRLAQSGLRSIDYANGRSYQLDTAARMSVRTGLSQLSGKIMESNLASTGQDLVITSQHMGSRPEHAPWQNKVFSYSGKNKKYPNFFKETGYGTATGLKGVNCTHDFYPFWEGASVIPEDIKEPAPVTINGKEYGYYQVSQQQRKMERDIRATKREIEAQKAIGGDTAELQGILRKQTSDYKRFSAAAGVKVKNNRLRASSGSSDLNKQIKGFDKLKSNKGMARIPQIPASSVSKKIEIGEYSTKLKQQEYQKHVDGTVKYKEYLDARTAKGGNPQSILTISSEEAQNIIDNKAGTGIIKVDRNGNPRPQEQITCDNVIGKYYYKGDYIDTKKAVIHYSKRGAHIVPIRGNNYD
ncbi:MAG: polymorphic toxin type 50 domain-containing protein [Clostridiales bacterium]|nr:polymorphic toxin type 50 domain-containing protein [Clostridiales bacterium]